MEILMDKETLGYLASFFVALSFFMTDQTKLRLINSVGCVLFMFYAYLLDSVPVFIPNFIVLILHIKYFSTHKKETEESSQ